MKKFIIFILLFPAIAHADERFKETQPLRIEANITTVSGTTITDQGTAVSSDNMPVQQPTIAIDEADGPTQDGGIILIKTIRVDF